MNTLSVLVSVLFSVVGIGALVVEYAATLLDRRRSATECADATVFHRCARGCGREG